MRKISSFSTLALALGLLAAAQIFPAAAQTGFADPAFQRVWERTDAPVASGVARRSWLWGPQPGVTTSEPYAEGPGGVRKVQYFDKSRMEINNPAGDPNSQFFVTNGLLTVELISGRIQVGNNAYQASVPANIPLASDADDASAPTYASFAAALNAPKQNLTGKKLGQSINRAGNLASGNKYEAYVGSEIAHYEPTTGRNIPAVFWNFVNSSGPIMAGGQLATGKLSEPWFFATGLPISEAYWATVKISGKQEDVLIQAFERRVLTYVPAFAPEWQVQMGNIGQHYYDWRYKGAGRGGGPGPQPPGTPGTGPSPGATPPAATPTQTACNVPAAVSGSVNPQCGPAGTTFVFRIFGFTPNEALSFWFTSPQGQVVGTDFPLPGEHPGQLELPLPTRTDFPPGLWSLTFQGEQSKHQSIIYFRVLPGAGPGTTPTPSGPVDTSVPPSRNGTVNPASGRAGTTFEIEVFGFQPNEEFSYWITDPTQAVYGDEQRFAADANGRRRLTFRSPSNLPPGVWSFTFHGIQSRHEAIIYIRILP